MFSSRRARLELVVATVVGCSAVLAVILYALNCFGDVNDYVTELHPAYLALYAGHVHAFWDLAPSYIGAVIWRVPFALVGLLFGSGWRHTYFLTAIPCFAALPIFGIWFAQRSGEPAATQRRIAWTFAAVAVADPIVWFTGLLGHPEEIVGVTLALAAVIVAADGAGITGLVLVALAVLNKPGLIEVVPIVVAACRRFYSGPLLGLMLAATALWGLDQGTNLFLDIGIGRHVALGSVGGPFFPFQFLWWLGPGSWIGLHEHAYIPFLCVAVAFLWWLRIRPARRAGALDMQRATLWCTALVLLVRTAFDPWDNIYYNLPLVICLLCLDVPRLPVMTTIASLAALVLVPTNRIIPVSGDAQAVLFAIGAVPGLLFLIDRSARGARVDRTVPSGRADADLKLAGGAPIGIQDAS